MDINAVGDYTVHLIRCAVNNLKPEPLPQGVTAKDVFIFAKRHLITSCIACVAQDFCNDDEVISLFQRDLQTALENEVKYSECSKKILLEFEKNAVDAMPFKGTDIRKYYPDNMPRISLDEDILVACEKKNEAETIMADLGFTKTDEGKKDTVFEKDGLIYELHKYALESENPAYAHYNSILRDCPLEAGYNHIRKMPFEDVYVFSVAHFYKHFTGGGAGLRFLLDLYFLNLQLRDGLSREHIKTKLQALDLRKFNSVMSDLADKLFSHASNFCLSFDEKDLLKYIYMHGCFGSESGFVSSLIKKKSAKHLKFKYLYYLWYTTFYQERRYRNYPILKKHPRAIYFCYVHTLFKKGIINRKSSKRDYKRYLKYESFCDKVYSICGAVNN
ncbi:MAG: nucleotidyltransferase family protein [Clostridiales bacterium]|nr:nucleotidyltransferase family protein [Clostridiales bacterium]